MSAFAPFFKGDSAQGYVFGWLIAPDLTLPVASVQHNAIGADIRDLGQINIGIGPSGPIQHSRRQNPGVPETRYQAAQICRPHQTMCPKHLTNPHRQRTRTSR